MELYERLSKFNPSTKEKLNDTFKKIAESFLYDGYISVSYNKKELYRIFIRTVEFYCHYEGKTDELWRKDPIVYHRNGRYVEGDVPYFPLMSFHAHASGYDITFEKEELQLRSSALIRAYEVYDMTLKKFLIYDTKDKIFKTSEDDNRRVNKQSTYLYNFLNGFIGNNIRWIDESRPKNLGVSEPVRRQNVFEYEYDESINDWKKKIDANGRYIKDERKWSFTRLDEIEKVEE